MMLTKELFEALWKKIQENGDADVQEATDVAKLAGEYAKRLGAFSFKDANGNVTHTLKWKDLSTQYQQDILAAILVEYGRTKHANLFYPAEHFSAADEWKKTALKKEKDKTLSGVDLPAPADGQATYLTGPLDKTTMDIMRFILDRVENKVRVEGYKDYTTEPESRRVAISIYEIMKHLGLNDFQTAKDAAQRAAFQLGNVSIRFKTEPQNQEMQGRAFDYAAASSYLFETGISQIIAKALEESLRKKKVPN